MTIPIWFNDIFILNLIGIIGGGGIYCLTFILKSRCRNINCCCISCERDTIPATELNQVNITS